MEQWLIKIDSQARVLSRDVAGVMDEMAALRKEVKGLHLDNVAMLWGLQELDEEMRAGFGWLRRVVAKMEGKEEEVSDEEEVKTDGVRVLENESDAGDENGEDGDGDEEPEAEGENNGDVEMIVE